MTLYWTPSADGLSTFISIARALYREDESKGSNPIKKAESGPDCAFFLHSARGAILRMHYIELYWWVALQQCFGARARAIWRRPGRKKWGNAEAPRRFQLHRMRKPWRKAKPRTGADRSEARRDYGLTNPLLAKLWKFTFSTRPPVPMAGQPAGPGIPCPW